MCRQSHSVSLTVASANADVYVGHPGVCGILYLEPDKRPDGFDRVITVPAAPFNATVSERMAHAAASLGVRPDRCRPHIHLTSLDTLRTERLELGRPDQPIVALCLSEMPSTDPDRQRRWETICQSIERQWNAAIILLSGADRGLRVHKNLAGRLMPREAAAVLSRCTVWLGDDATYAVLAQAVDVGGVYVSDAAVLEADQLIYTFTTEASDQQILDALNAGCEEKTKLNGN